MSRESDHDEAVGGVARLWDREPSFTAYANPGQEHIEEYNGEWPDVVVKHSGTSVVIAVCEVETEDSVTDKEAEQWARYASGDAHFYLYVPRGKCDDARMLCEKHSIECEAIHEYLLPLESFLATEC